MIFNIARRFEDAVREARAAIELGPSHSMAYAALGRGLGGLGRNDEAVDTFRRLVNIAPKDPYPRAWLGWALAAVGDRHDALAILGDLERQRSESYIGGTLLAWVCVGLGDHDRAISWLRQAADDRDGLMTDLNYYFYDPLRSDPRFQALLERMNLPAQTQS